MLLAALGTAVLLTGLVQSAATGAEPPGDDAGGLTSGFRLGYDAVIGNTYACGPASDETCPYTHLHIRTPNDWDDPDGQEIVAVRIVDLATGVPVSTGDAVFHVGPSADDDHNFDSGGDALDPMGHTNGYITVDTAAPLAPGAYRIEARFERPAHWTCSVDNQPQCIWLMTLGWTGEWRFRYDGATKVVQPMYRPATTALTHRFKRKGAHIISAGRVLTAVVDPVSFLLGPVRATPRAKVKVWTLRQHRWVHRTTVTTHADGTYRARVRQPTRTLIKVRVLRTHTYPSMGFATSYKK